jgi:CDGSH-type Zn-finger protein/mannose-6-phosphate isomerase-like protein (cupin superfamily)
MNDESVKPPGEPVIARLKPFLIELQEGRTYLWCSCGRSKRQPFCDGSHKGTGFEPRKHVAERSEEVLFCGCKHTRAAPFCDGAHNNLPGGAPPDDPDSPDNLGVAMVGTAGDGRAVLNGGCYVFTPAGATMLERGPLRYCTTISASLGAQHQSQLLLQVQGEASPVIAFGDSQVILFVAGGRGAIEVSGKRFAVTATDGVSVRPAEAFRLVPDAGDRLEVYASAYPLADISWPEHMPGNFVASCPERVARVDTQRRTDMGPRYFQCLVDKTFGAQDMAQFIGHIPQSKAAPHRHLYEESLVVLSGEGCMWTDDRKAVVRQGDVLFLPRKQVHSLQATSASGLDLMGVIAPGDNPSINY